MLASVFGALIGLSLGMVFLQGHRRHRSHRPAAEAPLGHLPMGTLVMAVDLVVIALAVWPSTA